MRSSLPGPLERRLAALTPDQRTAALAPPGPVLCVAPAGSGKTTTVVARISVRVARGADPATIRALTFNRRAADELQERVDAALAELAIAPGSVPVRTFHALGREILADAGVDVTRIVDRGDLLARLVDGRPSSPVLRALDDAFSRLKLDPEMSHAADDPLIAAFRAYQDELARLEALDLDDLVARALPALAADPDLLGRWRDRGAILFVDEAQDLDRSQLELVLMLAGDRRDVFLVGDDDQTIYAWRLADVRRILGLAARLPGLRRVDLTTNHRCPPEVVRRAARLVSRNRERFEKSIEPAPRAHGDLLLAPDPGDDVARARRLLTAWGPGTDASASWAVLARTNRELAPYAAVALERRIPYRVDDDASLLEHDEVERIIGLAARHRGPGGPLAAIRAAAIEAGASAVILSSLLAWAAGHADVAALHGAVAAARTVRRGSRRDDAPLTLATVHGTKGLEWDHVACVGFDAERFPNARSVEEAPDPGRALEEERRLAYVAWTRARRSLTIVYDPHRPSTFLREAFEGHELAGPTASRPAGRSAWARRP